MRKPTIKSYVTLECQNCHASFLKEKKEYDRKIQNGKTRFFCSQPCFNGDTSSAEELKNKYRCKELAPFRRMLSRAKQNSKHRGLQLELTLDHLVELWEKQKGICPYTHLKMRLQLLEEQSPQTASLDRIDSQKGYTADNVELVCYSVNLGKNGFSRETMQNFLAETAKALSVKTA